MNPNQSHLAGLELALQQWNNGGPAAHFAAQLRGLIAEAQQADHSEHVLHMVNICKLGMHGAAYDAPDTCRAYTYAALPGNSGAWRLGAATREAYQAGGGDYIDYGLGLLKSLQERGFGVFEIAATPSAKKDLGDE